MLSGADLTPSVPVDPGGMALLECCSCAVGVLPLCCFCAALVLWECCPCAVGVLLLCYSCDALVLR